MATFTFHLHDGTDRAPPFEIEMFDTPEQAIAHARKLLTERARYVNIVITRDETVIGRLGRRRDKRETTFLDL